MLRKTARLFATNGFFNNRAITKISLDIENIIAKEIDDSDPLGSLKYDINKAHEDYEKHYFTNVTSRSEERINELLKLANDEIQIHYQMRFRMLDSLSFLRDEIDTYLKTE